MTPYLLALGLWTLCWAGGAWVLNRRLDRRHVQVLQWLENNFPGPWEH